MFICFFGGKLMTLRNKPTKLQATWTKGIALWIPTTTINLYKQTNQNYLKKWERIWAQPCNRLGVGVKGHGLENAKINQSSSTNIKSAYSTQPLECQKNCAWRIHLSQSSLFYAAGEFSSRNKGFPLHHFLPPTTFSWKILCFSHPKQSLIEKALRWRVYLIFSEYTGCLTLLYSWDT